ncbi:hypothetical protein [Chryseobacterium sp.]|uniref:hypothetical protein n=1 Tax=Chryseobacterium sp. TaxID=1871047 RepID=UPI0025C005AC|nr:hypothetical protein [Chryseobacterium sp.]MBV8326699.1 hypothetical protein [Chryseobacterium sp.]
MNNESIPIKITRSGQKCPVSGLWKSKGAFTTTIIIAEKSTMPDYGGQKVAWILLYQC